MSTVEYSENSLYRRVSLSVILSWVIVGILYTFYIGGFSFMGAAMVLEYGTLIIDLYGGLINLLLSAAVIIASLVILKKIWFLIGKQYIILHALTFSLNFVIYLGICLSLHQVINFPAIALAGATIALVLFMSSYTGLKTVGDIGEYGYKVLLAFVLPTWSMTALSTLLVEIIISMQIPTVIGQGGLVGTAFLGSIGAAAMVLALLLTHYRFGTKEVSLHMP